MTQDPTDEIHGSIRDIATMFADMSTDLGRFSEQLRTRLADIETAQRDKTDARRARGSSTPDRLPPPTSAMPSVPVPLPGEPVDTSYARPVETPAAHAAGASPYSDPLPAEHPVPSGAPEPSRAFPAGPVPVFPPASHQPEPPLLDRVAHWASRHGTKLLAWAGGAVTLLSIVLLLGAGAPALLAAPILGRWAAFCVVAAVAGVNFVLWLGQKFFWHRHLPARLGVAAGGACALAVFQASVATVDGSARSVVLLGEATVLAVLAIRSRSRGILLTSTVYGGAGALLACAVDIPPTLFLSFPARPFVVDGLVRQSALIPGLLAFLFLGAAATASARGAVTLQVLRPWHPSLSIPAIALLYGSGGVVLSGCLAVSPTESSFLLAHTLITLLWVVAAFLLLLRGVRSVPHRAVGFILIFAALAKLALFDLAALNGMARVGTFLAAGLMLLVGGTRYARLVADRQRSSTV